MNTNDVIDVLKNGGLVIAPSDTVYGILGDALNEEVINKVYEAKQRDKSKSLILLVNSIDMLKKYVAEISTLERRLINEFWPGKLTIIFKKNNNISNLLTGNRDTIGIRYPDNEFLLDILNKIDRPLFSTSANISNKSTITSVNKIDDILLNYIDLIIDGGEIDASSSTIVSCENDKINILREGDLTKDILKWCKKYK